MTRPRQRISPRGAAVALVGGLLLLVAGAGDAQSLRARTPPRSRCAPGSRSATTRSASWSSSRRAARCGRWPPPSAWCARRGRRPARCAGCSRAPSGTSTGCARTASFAAHARSPDLNLYFEIALPASQDAAALCDALNALPVVELALPGRLPLPPPVDLPPATPSFVTGQGYRAAAPGGIDAVGAARIPGANGAGIAIVDVEYQWVLDHEDLELGAEANLETATLLDPFPGDEGNHGTASLGILRALDNGYGVLGLAPAALLFVAPTNTVQHGYDPARAIGLALDVLVPGDVLLLEQQTWVCGGPLGPLEGYPPWFDAIANATAQGVVVVEPAGNGGLNLDSPACGGWFDRNVRDSGAILVSAGSPFDRSRLGFSSYGSRADVQGWGSGVYTAGYGALFDPGDVRQRYTAYFGGTSGASAIVAGAVASVQGALLAHGMTPLEPAEMRDAAREHGHAAERPGPDRPAARRDGRARRARHRGAPAADAAGLRPHRHRVRAAADSARKTTPAGVECTVAEEEDDHAESGCGPGPSSRARHGGAGQGRGGSRQRRDRGRDAPRERRAASPDGARDGRGGSDHPSRPHASGRNEGRAAARWRDLRTGADLHVRAGARHGAARRRVPAHAERLDRGRLRLREDARAFACDHGAAAGLHPGPGPRDRRVLELPGLRRRSRHDRGPPHRRRRTTC